MKKASKGKIPNYIAIPLIVLAIAALLFGILFFGYMVLGFRF